jgi:hypothetical protein
VLLGVSLLNLGTTFSRREVERTAKLNWGEQLRACSNAPGPVVQVPIYGDGSTAYWTLAMKTSDCLRYAGR